MAKFDSPTDRMFQELGLMKPDGELTFDPTGGTGFIYDRDDDDDSPAGREFTVTEDGGIAGDVETRSNPQPSARGTATVVTEPKQTTGQWDSPDNPYKARYEELAGKQPSPTEILRNNHDAAQDQLVSWVRDAYNAGVAMRDAEGNPVHDPATLRMQLTAAHDRVANNLRLQYERELTAPVAVRYAAEDIANRHGNGKVKPEDLIGLPDANSMVAVAQYIAKNGGGTATAQTQTHNQQRDAQFQARRESGVDAAETGSPLSRSVMDSFAKLSPKDKIAYSLTYQGGNRE